MNGSRASDRQTNKHTHTQTDRIAYYCPALAVARAGEKIKIMILHSTFTLLLYYTITKLVHYTIKLKYTIALLFYIMAVFVQQMFSPIALMHLRK